MFHVPVVLLVPLGLVQWFPCFLWFRWLLSFPSLVAHDVVNVNGSCSFLGSCTVVPLVLVVPVVLQCGSNGSSCVSSESRRFLFIVVIVVPVGLTRGYRGYKHNN